jgi:hypothetical protein
MNITKNEHREAESKAQPTLSCSITENSPAITILGFSDLRPCPKFVLSLRSWLNCDRRLIQKKTGKTDRPSCPRIHFRDLKKCLLQNCLLQNGSLKNDSLDDGATHRNTQPV